MKQIITQLVLLITFTLISSCEFIGNAFDYGKTTETFTEALIQEDYNKCLDLFAMEHESAQNVNEDTLKSGLVEFRTIIVNNFGSDLQYSFMKSEKKFSSVESESTVPNTTNVLVQIKNQEEFGVLKVIFDDQSKKIMNIRALDVKESIPNMIPFWLFGLLAICIPIFNIYVIGLIRNSTLERKWLKYIAILILNVPSVSYSAVGGLAIKPLFFQFLLGISFNYMGYMNAVWTFGIPLGGLYWFWKIKNNKDNITNPKTEDTIIAELREE